MTKLCLFGIGAESSNTKLWIEVQGFGVTAFFGMLLANKDGKEVDFMNRRSFFKALTLLGSMPVLSRVVSAAPVKVSLSDIKKETPVAVVYHCDFPQEARFKTMLTNIGNHLSVYDNDPFKIKIVVVAHGPGVKFFMKDLSGSPWENEPINISELERREKDLTLYGVEYYICNITLNRLRLDPNKLHDFTKIVPSGVGAIGDLQSKGFGYIKVQ